MKFHVNIMRVCAFELHFYSTAVPGRTRSVIFTMQQSSHEGKLGLQGGFSEWRQSTTYEVSVRSSTVAPSIPNVLKINHAGSPRYNVSSNAVVSLPVFF